MDAGSELGIRPFGTETQRVLRLEKMHIIPNQDTDMVSNPLDAGMRWVVRMDKDDFIGRGGLAAAMDRPARSRLVGFVMQNGAVPHDGDAVVADMAPVGRVTSSRLSPTMGKGFGFCWVPTNWRSMERPYTSAPMASSRPPRCAPSPSTTPMAGG